jgi:superfamily I DNA and/or RNA helicase
MFLQGEDFINEIKQLSPLEPAHSEEILRETELAIRMLNRIKILGVVFCRISRAAKPPCSIFHYATYCFGGFIFLSPCTFGCAPDILQLQQQKYDQAYRSGQITISEYLNLTSQLEFQREQLLFGMSPALLNYSIQQEYINQWSRPNTCDIFSIRH